MIPAFFISELRITGENVRDAVIEFRKGLNYVTGPSNTGKSYIYECIDYIFGSKRIKELINFKEYTHVFLEITLQNGDKRTLMRKIKDSKILLYNMAISDIVDLSKPATTLNSKNIGHSISDYVFSLLGVNNLPSVLKGATLGNTVELSLRNFLKFFFVDETRIIEDKAKILTDGFNDTVLVSVFRYILTGTDDSSCVAIEKPELRRAKIEGRIEMLEIVLARLLSKESCIKASISEFAEVSYAHITIEEYQKEIEAYQIRIDELTKLLVKKQDDYVNSEQCYAKEKVTLSRLTMLKEQYISDLDRLEFSRDGVEICGHVQTDICPLCHSTGIAKNKEGEVDIEKIKIGYIAEVKHISSLLHDLDLVISESQNHVEELRNGLDSIQMEISAITQEIVNINNTKMSPLQNTVEQYSRLRSLKEMLISIGAEVMETHQELEDEKEKLKQKNEEQTYRPTIEQEEKQEFCGMIRTILAIWNIECNRIELSADCKDYCIDEQERVSNGKGYRAIFFSAFIYAIQRYLHIKERICFPCIMLDSPLTTLRGVDKKLKDDPDAVNDSIQHGMLSYISTVDYVQSIILENKEIAEDIEPKANVIRFSGLETEGRYGLFPIEK